jgi:hypothetical protein
MKKLKLQTVLCIVALAMVFSTTAAKAVPPNTHLYWDPDLHLMVGDNPDPPIHFFMIEYRPITVIPSAWVFKYAGMSAEAHLWLPDGTYEARVAAYDSNYNLIQFGPSAEIEFTINYSTIPMVRSLMPTGQLVNAWNYLVIPPGTRKLVEISGDNGNSYHFHEWLSGTQYYDPLRDEFFRYTDVHTP